MPVKCVLLLLDGIGDRAYEVLRGQTPLQAAHTPALDAIAAMGCNGLYHAGVLGQALPSENAHFAMFGYDETAFPGRGALEALGAGLSLMPDEVAVLAHLVSVRHHKGCLLLAHEKPVLPQEQARALINAIMSFDHETVTMRFHPTHQLNGIVILKGAVERFVTDSDPVRRGQALTDVVPWQAYRSDPGCRRAAQALKAYLVWVHRTLQQHAVNRRRQQQGLAPVNAMVTQRAGRLKSVQRFEAHCGLKGLSLASGLVYQGLSRYIGMDYKKVYDSGDPGQDIAARLQMARRRLEHYNFIHVHTKTPDEAGHSKDPAAKRQVIEALDRGIGQALPQLQKDSEMLLVVTADHATPAGGPLIHSGEAVPLTLCGRGVRRDIVQHFDEISAAQGALGSVRGKELLYLVLNHLERAKLRGIMDTPEDQPFWPGPAKPLRLD